MSAAASVPARRRIALPPWAIGALGAVGLVALWWILAATVLGSVGPGDSQAIPTPWQVIEQWGADGWEYYQRNFSVTMVEASWGFVWGNGAALVLAAFVLVIPQLEGAITQLAIISYCVPIIAIGMLVSIIIPSPSPGEPAGTAVLLAALSCFFTTVVGALLGFKSADRASLDVVRVYGGGRFTQLRKVRLIAAVPSILTALQIAVPATFLGAILGEYLGGVDTGVGPAMTSAQASLNAARVWGIALACGAVAMVGYLLWGLLARFVTPWSKGGRS